MNDIRKIMALLLLLVVSFVVGLWVMSSLNLRYSQEALSELRLRQLEEAFQANLNRINSHHALVERDAGQLARLGEMIWRLHKHDAGDYDTTIEEALGTQMQEYSEALGGGTCPNMNRRTSWLGSPGTSTKISPSSCATSPALGRSAGALARQRSRSASS